MSSQFEPDDSETRDLTSEERRSSERQDVSGGAILRIGHEVFEAIVRNRSKEGLLVVIGEPIRVELELGEGAARHSETALVRRIGSLPGGSYGVGLELVPDEPVE